MTIWEIGRVFLFSFFMASLTTVALIVGGSMLLQVLSGIERLFVNKTQRQLVGISVLFIVCYLIWLALSIYSWTNTP